MLIKFKSPDPRAGMTVRMDSSLGQQFVDAGNAEKVEDNAPAPVAPAAPAPAPEPAAEKPVKTSAKAKK